MILSIILIENTSKNIVTWYYVSIGKLSRCLLPMSNLGIQDYGWCDGFGISRQQLCSLIGMEYLMAKDQKEKRSTNPKDWYIWVFCTRISFTLVASILSTNDTAINNFIQWLFLFIIIYLYRYLHLVINRYLWEYLFTIVYDRIIM